MSFSAVLVVPSLVILLLVALRRRRRRRRCDECISFSDLLLRSSLPFVLFRCFSLPTGSLFSFRPPMDTGDVAGVPTVRLVPLDDKDKSSLRLSIKLRRRRLDRSTASKFPDMFVTKLS